MANIDPYISELKSAIYGEEVRNSIINSLKAMNTQNDTLETDVKNTTQNTLDNFRVYEQVNDLPAVGNPQLIYCVSDIVTTDSDSGVCGDAPSSEGALKWDADQGKPFFTNSTARIGADTEEFVDYIDENITKPVMARYYITDNSKIQYYDSQQQLNYSIDTLNLYVDQIPYVFKTPNSETSGNLKALRIVSAQLSGSEWSMNGNARVHLECDEFIYDSETEKWYFNRTITMNTGYVRTSTPTWDGITFANTNDENILAIQALPQNAYRLENSIAYGWEMVYGWAGVSYIPMKNYVNEFESTKGRLASDSYGYDTYNHSKYWIIEYKESQDMDLNINADETIPTAPNKWKVIIRSSDRAFMYIWNQALERYIELVGGSRLAPPDTDGTYVLKCTVTEGVATYAWVAET